MEKVDGPGEDILRRMDAGPGGYGEADGDRDVAWYPHA